MLSGEFVFVVVNYDLYNHHVILVASFICYELPYLIFFASSYTIMLSGELLLFVVNCNSFYNHDVV